MTKNNQIDPGTSLVETLQLSELTDILKDISELGLDTALQDGLFKEIPIINWVVSIGKTVAAVRDYFLLKKILRFLEGLEEVSFEERSSFFREIGEDEKRAQNVGETIVLLLDRYDHLDKALLMAKIFCAYLKQNIELDDFLRIATSIDRAYLEDLKVLLAYFADEKIEKSDVRQAKRNLYTSDFSDFYVITEEEFKRSELEHPQVYHFSQRACKFAKIVLGDRYHDDRW